jgi:small-conductance mechanosensitive channel
MLGLNFALGLVGVEMVGFFASLAVFSLVVALAAQQTLGNILNSSMLALDQPFEVGDRIEVDGVTGTVVSFGTLSTKILTLTEHLVIIPNNTLVSSTIVNHARGGGDGIARRLSLHIDFSVDYREKNVHVKDVIARTAKKCPYVTGDPEPRTLMRHLNEYSKDFRLYAWIDDYNDEFLATDWLLREVDEAFEREGISIPYPIAVELEHKPDPFEGEENRERRVKKKKARQHLADMRQKEDELKFQEERDNAREEIEFLENLLETGAAKASEREEIQNDIDALKAILARFTE